MKCIALIVVILGLSPIQTRATAAFDYFLFVQEWPETVCQAARKQVCKIPVNCTGWGIHGIWPTKLGTEGPTYCNESATFSWEAIESLTGELMEYWPNCYIHTPFWSFWEHEYLKHGTCCEGISSMSTEYGFFLTTLNLYKKHQINGVLESGNIHPSNTTTYTVSKIMDTIHSATGHVPLLYCYNKQTNVQILQQIVLCMNKQFDLIDCPEEPHAYCYKDEPVLYPQRPSTS